MTILIELISTIILRMNLSERQFSQALLRAGGLLQFTQLLMDLFQQLALIFDIFIDIVVLEQSFGSHTDLLDIAPQAPAIILLLSTRRVCRRIGKRLR